MMTLDKETAIRKIVEMMARQLEVLTQPFCKGNIS